MGYRRSHVWIVKAIQNGDRPIDAQLEEPDKTVMCVSTESADDYRVGFVCQILDGLPGVWTWGRSR